MKQKKVSESTDEDFMVESWSKQDIRELREEMQGEGRVSPVFYDEGEIYE